MGNVASNKRFGLEKNYLPTDMADRVHDATEALRALGQLTSMAMEGGDDMSLYAYGVQALYTPHIVALQDCVEVLSEQRAKELRERGAVPEKRFRNEGPNGEITVEDFRESVIRSAVGSGLVISEVAAGMNLPAETVKRIVEQLRGGAAASTPEAEPERKAG